MTNTSLQEVALLYETLREQLRPSATLRTSSVTTPTTTLSTSDQ
ncbi:MAG: hypothetical protein V7K71_28375 [Nostoc sp.]